MIPNIVHFNYGLMPQNDDFLFVYYISVLSCKLINNPDKIYFHYHWEPRGYWWEKTKEIVNIIKIDVPTHIGKKEIKKVAHRSDIARMEALKKYGGIYLDIDTICIRSYKDLLHNKFVIANEITESGKNMGLCNAIMMTEPEGSFITEWLSHYEEHFNPDGWQEASTYLPFRLANTNKNLTILKPSNFLLPSWESIDLIFEKPNEISDDLIVLHYWNQYSIKRYLNNIKNFDWVINNSHTLYGKALINIFSKLTQLNNNINNKIETNRITNNLPTVTNLVGIKTHPVIINDFDFTQEVKMNSDKSNSKIVFTKIIPNIYLLKQIENCGTNIELLQNNHSINLDNLDPNETFYFVNSKYYNNNQVANFIVKPVITINDVKIFTTHKYIDQNHILIEIFRTDSDNGWDQDLFLDVNINNKSQLYQVGKSNESNKMVMIKTSEKLEQVKYNNQIIPKKIFQTWKTNKMETQMINTIKIIQGLNPEYEYKLFTDNECLEFIKNNFGQKITNAFNNLVPGAFKADLFRYCVLYIEGGIYIDCKMIPTIPFRNIIKSNDPCVLVKNTFEKNSTSIYNAFICTEPKNKLFLECINEIVSNSENLIYPQDVFMVTGPSLLYKNYCKLNYNARLLTHPNIGLPHTDHNNGIFNEANELIIYKTYKNYYKNNNGGGYVLEYNSGNCWANILDLLTVYKPVKFNKIKNNDFVIANIESYDEVLFINPSNELDIDTTQIKCSNGLLLITGSNPWTKLAELDLNKFSQIYLKAKTFYNEPQVCIQNKIDMFKRINQTHKLIHAHGDNNYDLININNKKIPMMLSLTYLRNDLDKFELNKENLPGDLDIRVVNSRSDYDLNFAPFVN